MLITLSGEMLNMFPVDAQHHRAIIQYLREKNIEFIVITPKSERPLKVVLKDRHHNTPIEEINQVLVLKWFEDVKITNMD
ncbi:hypothetical protein CEXT_493541 [Caerostris extrusa]|uniref:Uncharacterized protein n=1 Tax=Caerostris extrusa TaxID=172846 RepID=A0AAV4N3J2_CAEEX|nr:hypothetical protein CEXT_493541 [Caerostris extrusa]